MAVIIMPPAADWNAKAEENISCWYCQHFQRYGEIQQEMVCEGECRKQPPRAAAYTKELEKPADWQQDGYFTYIPFANVGWCNGFQRSLEQDIPDPPGSPEPKGSDCPHQDPITWIPPDFMRTENLPSKKPLEQSCWFCEAFQRQFEDPEHEAAPPAENRCRGYCQHGPQPDYFTFEGRFEHEILVQHFPVWTKITFAPLTWCSRWERTRRPVPDVPKTNDIVCQSISPP